MTELVKLVNILIMAVVIGFVVIVIELASLNARLIRVIQAVAEDPSGYLGEIPEEAETIRTILRGWPTLSPGFGEGWDGA